VVKPRLLSHATRTWIGPPVTVRQGWLVAGSMFERSASQLAAARIAYSLGGPDGGFQENEPNVRAPGVGPLAFGTVAVALPIGCHCASGYEGMTPPVTGATHTSTRVLVASAGPRFNPFTQIRLRLTDGKMEVCPLMESACARRAVPRKSTGEWGPPGWRRRSWMCRSTVARSWGPATTALGPGAA